MPGRLQRELHQRAPFESLEQEVFLNIQRTADSLNRGLAELLKSSRLSPTQYNVLRILRGAGNDGLTCTELGERMVTRDPDVTRLLDRMEKRGLVGRARDDRDRRVVTIRISETGLATLKELDAPVLQMHQNQLGHLHEDELSRLVTLLEQARERLR